MMITNKWKSKDLGIILYVIISLLLLVSHETFVFGMNESSKMRTIGTYIHVPISLVLGSMFVLKWKKLVVQKHCRKTMLFSGIAILMIWLTFTFVERETLNQYVYKSLMIFEAAVLICLFDRQQLLKAIERCLFVLAGFSVLVYGVYLIFPNLVESFPRVTNMSGLTLNFLGLSMSPMQSTDGFSRSTSIFREPGVMVIFMFIGLYLILFEEKKLHPRFVVYVLAILLSFSTTGYIVLPLIMVVYAAKNIKTIVKNKRILFSILVLIVIVLVFMFVTPTGVRLRDFIFSKFSRGNYSFISADARITSVAANIDTAMHNPVLGAGIYGTTSSFLAYSDLYSITSTKHNTNSILILLANFGFVFWGLLLFLLVHFFRKRNALWIAVCLFGVWFLALSGEDLTNNVVLYLFVFAGVYTIGEDTAENSSEVQLEIPL